MLLHLGLPEPCCLVAEPFMHAFAKQAFPTPCDIHSTATNCTLFAATDASWAALASYLSKTVDQLAITPVMTPVIQLALSNKMSSGGCQCIVSVLQGCTAQDWPSMSQSAEKFVVACLSCSTINSSPKSASTLATWRTALPTRPSCTTSS